MTMSLSHNTPVSIISLWPIPGFPSRGCPVHPTTTGGIISLWPIPGPTNILSVQRDVSLPVVESCIITLSSLPHHSLTKSTTTDATASSTSTLDSSEVSPLPTVAVAEYELMNASLERQHLFPAPQARKRCLGRF
jgi:hypothetical protein